MIKFVIGLVISFLFCKYINNYFVLFVYLLYYTFCLKIHLLVYWKIKDFIAFLKDFINNNYFQRIYGVHGIVGEYGQGKGVALAVQFKALSKKLVFCGRCLHNPSNYIFISNCYMKGCDSFSTLSDVMKYYNVAMTSGKGLIVFWDEIQNEFPENDRNFPQQFRFLLTQNRKLYGVRIIWTSQDYTRVNKNIRLMTSTVSQMRTFFNRYTVQKIYRRVVYDDYYQTVNILKRSKKRCQKINIIVQTDNLRNDFNSFEILESAKKISNLY